MSHAQPEDEKVGFAIVGLGAQAERIADAIQTSSNARLRAVASRNLQRAQSFAKRWRVPFFGTCKNILKRPDVRAVFICSPNHRHREESILAARAKKHIICEKPMALSVAEAKQIAQSVQKNRVLFGVNLHLRFHPILRAARALISSGTLGSVPLITMHWSIGNYGEEQLPPLPPHSRWKENPKLSGGGALMSRGVHLIDLVQFLTGETISETASLDDRSATQKVDQLISCVLRAGHTLAAITTGRRVPPGEDQLVVYGSNATLSVKHSFTERGTGEMRVRKKNKKSKIFLKKFKKPENLHRTLVENFSDAVARKTAWTGATLEDGIRSVKITATLVRKNGHMQ